LIVPNAILADGSAVTYSSRNGYSAVYKLDLATMKVGEKLFDGGAYDLSGIYLDSDRSKITGYSFTDTRRHTVWIDDARKKLQAQLEANFPNKQVRILGLIDIHDSQTV